MPLDPVPQLDEIDALLDDLASSPTLDVYQAMLPYDGDMVAAAAAHRALAGGGGGGTAGLRLFDPGTITVADLLAAGPRLIYTPPELQFVGVDYIRQDAADVDNGARISVSTVFNQGGTYFAAQSGQGDFQNFILNTLYPSLQHDNWFHLYSTDPIYAVLQVSESHFALPGPAVEWAASHAYATDDIIVAVDPINGGSYAWIMGDAPGSSGGSLPVFDSLSGPVADGGISWSVIGMIPTTGTAHPILWVGTIEALVS